MNQTTMKDYYVRNMTDPGFAILFILGVIVMLGLIVAVSVTECHAGEITEEVAVSCILGEARGEGYAGMLAVAEGIRNRGNIKRVDGCGYQADDRDPIQTAFKAWNDSQYTNTVDKADHWHATYVNPYWAKYGTVTAKIGKHIFYKQVVKR